MNPNALPDTPAAPRRIPSYRRHKPSGQAVATFGGRDFYLGAFGSKASKAEYRRRLAEWLAAGCPTAPKRRSSADARGRGSPFLRHLHPQEDEDAPNRRCLRSSPQRGDGL
jgi:hypothetical protein